MRERGAALVVVIMAMLLLSALGASLVVTSAAEGLIAANAGAGSETFYAASAAFERTLAELRDAPTFTAVLGGAVTSRFGDGPPGPRVLPDGSRLNLTEAVNLANCQKSTGCSAAELDAPLRDRPWRARNPRWVLFAHGPLVSGAAASTGLPVYVLTMVADDPAETDGDPWQDGGRVGGGVNPGAGILLVRAEAYGRRGTRRIIEGSVVRLDLVARAAWEAGDAATRGVAPSTVPALQVLGWRDLR